MNARPEVLVISPSLPEVIAEHAGGVLLREVTRWQAQTATVRVIVPDGPSVRRAQAAPWIEEIVVVPTPSGQSRWHEVAFRYLGAGRTPRWFRTGLRRDPQARRLLRTADVVDLQWQEQAHLLPVVRRVNPAARTVLTLHDVLSQQLERESQSLGRRGPARTALRARNLLLRRRVLRDQARFTRTAGPDRVVVLSPKDADLLPDSPRVRVLRPPLAEGYRHVRRDATQARGRGPRPLVLFVAYWARWSNEQGLQWFLHDVVPILRARHPDLRVVLAGGGIRETVRAAAQASGAELTGFVPDLAPWYSRADVAVVPLLQGAGVKFKTVDALAAGVPVVATPVGAEGIGEPDWFAGITEDPERFARDVLAVLSDPEAAARRAARARAGVERAFGRTPFEQTLAEVYGLPPHQKEEA